MTSQNNSNIKASRSDVIGALNSLEHAMFHIKQGESEHAQRPLHAAISKLKKAILSDVICASTAAFGDDESARNIIVGVTAHCRCGHVFCGDVVAANGIGKGRIG